MNLEGIVRGYIAAVNPLVPLLWRAGPGSTTNADGTRTPTYADAVTLQGQVQPLSSKDLRQIEGLNLNGKLQAVYFQGLVNDIVRSMNLGGDLLTDTNGNIWLVNQVLEAWPDWVKIVCTLQDGA